MKDTYFGKAPGSAEAQIRGPHAALLVDFDNVTLGIRSNLQAQLKAITKSDIFKGKISVQRAYADWRRYPQYIVPLSEASFDLIFAPAFGANKKNATDIRLAIDALELVFVRPEIGTYILLSGDSDFSSLVLKLKEYGKYVIGIGIRESSSDLLVQNCDEYYGYSELTGLSRAVEREDTAEKDPWELVVQAVVQMKERSDVMRSDRLKQVMQEIDPHFSEKNAGFNKFSKFVNDAGKRGLLKLRKLDNGQHEVDLGPDANVEPDVEKRLRKAETASETPDGSKSEEKPSPLNLSAGFDVLKRALRQLGANGDAVFEAEVVRKESERLVGPNPVLTGGRFIRLLRQAHDAELIELAKDAKGNYTLRLAERDPVGTEGGTAGEDSQSEDGEKDDEPEPPHRDVRNEPPSAPGSNRDLDRSPNHSGKPVKSLGRRKGAREAENKDVVLGFDLRRPSVRKPRGRAAATGSGPTVDETDDTRAPSGSDVKVTEPAESSPTSRRGAEASKETSANRGRAPRDEVQSPPARKGPSRQDHDDSLLKRVSGVLQRAIKGDK